MADKKSNKSSFVLDCLVSLLALAVVGAGIALSMYALGQLVEATKIDANALMRSPSTYMDIKRDLIVEGLSFMIPGIVILLLGEFVLSIAFARLITIMREGQRIIALEKRIANLEKKLKK